ncbi:hypothetical protein D3C72_1379990 [compost metagenome]
MQAREHEELGLARRRHPGALGGWQWHAETTRLTDALVEVVEAWERLLDQVADLVVVGGQFQPGYRAVRQGRVGHAGDDRRLRTQEL